MVTTSDGSTPPLPTQPQPNTAYALLLCPVWLCCDGLKRVLQPLLSAALPGAQARQQDLNKAKALLLALNARQRAAQRAKLMAWLASAEQPTQQAAVRRECGDTRTSPAEAALDYARFMRDSDG